MGNSGSNVQPYTPPPPTPMPIEDDIKARHEAASMLAERTATASRSANDLGQGGAERAPAITRADLGTVGNAVKEQAAFQQQGRVRGPRKQAPATVAGGISRSAVVTG